MKLLKKTIKYLLVPAMLLGAVNGFSQDELREELYVHVDRNYYLAGERLHYAAYCTEKNSGQPSRISALAILDLLNNEGEVIFRERVSLKNGAGSGSFRIPLDVGSSEHILRCYTMWMRNYGPESFHYTPLLIIHPAKKYTPKNKPLTIPIPLQATKIPRQDKSSQITIGGLNRVYNSRDSIKFTIQSVPGLWTSCPARISLSVSRSESQLPDTFLSKKDPDENPGASPKWNVLRYMPDMQGLQISGTVKHQGSGEPVVNRDVLLSFIDTVSEISGVKTDRAGKFHFDLNGTRGKKDMIIQIPGENENIIISIDPDHSMDAIPEYIRTSLDRENLASLFREMLLEQQIASTYNLPAKSTQDYATNDKLHETIIPTRTNAALPFYGNADHEIIMEEFVKLPVMEEVFRELGKRVFLTRTEGKYKALLLDVETNRIIGEQPWYFLDGVPFFDSEKLLAIDPSKLQSISLKSQKYFVGDLVMDGIIDIRTKKGDASLIDFPRSAVRQYFLGFPGLPSDLSELTPAVNEKIPLYKITLLFEPQLAFDNTNAASITLIAPDSKGSYTIAVRGISPDGVPIQQDFSFIVRLNAKYKK